VILQPSILRMIFSQTAHH